MRARAVGWKACCVGLLAQLLPSCGFPSPEACALECGDQNACPGGFECQAASHLCVPVGTLTLCSLSGVVAAIEPPRESAAGDAGPPLEGAAGAGPEPAANAGAGGEGEAPDGGASGAGPAPGDGASGDGGLQAPPDVNELTIVETVDASGCSGSELSLPLRANGGVSPYAWRVVQAPAGVRLSSGAGTEVELQGVPVATGAVLVELEDSAGSLVRSAPHLVHATPQLQTEHLPSICRDEPYRAALLATGGDSGAYVWSAELVAAPGLPGSLAELGLSLQGSTLSADSDAPLAAFAPFQIAVRVQDGQCSSAPLALDVVPAGSEACPHIGILNPPAIDALPAPCLGNAYTESLSVEGGTAPYRWNALSTPPGLHFDAESATLSGVATGDGTLVVELTDAESRVVQKSYDVQPRDACWLAYVASEPAPARLELVDPRLLERQPGNARRQLPADVGLEGVLDFQFSPDGRWLAYRLGADSSSARIELAEVTSGEARELDFAGSVAAYAWSPDAATLAVVFTRGVQPLLGGVDVGAGGALLAAQAVASLPPELTWYDADRLALLTPDPELSEPRWLVTTRRAGNGFEALVPHLEAPFSSAAQLLAGAGGVFVMEPLTGLEQFFPSDGRPPVAHLPGGVVSPSGALTGSLEAGALELFRGLDPGSLPPFASAPGCTALLAWASGRERVACSAAGQDSEAAAASGSALALFDLQAAPAGLIALDPLRAAGLPDAAATSGQRRLLSASGRWFALASPDNLFVVQVDAARPRLWAALPTSALGSVPSALAFAPDETFLLIGAGNSLRLLDLEQGPGSLRELSASALFDDACSERFVDGRSQWCGSDSQASVSWSPGSDLVAFRSALGTLEVLDLTRLRQGEVGLPISPDAACSEVCRSSTTARFQP